MKDPDLMTEEELSAAFEAMPLPARQEAMSLALDDGLAPTQGLPEWFTGGVTSIPLGSPWPPLSREQVVKLHQALVEFTEGLLGVDPEDEGNWDTVRVAGRLEVVLRDLGIGRPAAKMSKRTWTHDDFAKASEMLAEEDGYTVTFRDALGQKVEPKPGDTIRNGQAIGAPAFPPNFRLDGDKAVDPRTGAVVGTVLKGAPPPGMSGTVVVQLDPAKAPTAWWPRARPVETPKRNCWSCKHDCTLPPPDVDHDCFRLGTVPWDPTPPKVQDAILAWRNDHVRRELTMMPLRNSDGCPGWEPKNETTRRECWTCRSFHINNGCGKKCTASAALAAHLRKMDDLIDGGASTTEVASMDLNCPGWERNP